MSKQCAVVTEYRSKPSYYPFLDYLKEIGYPNIIFVSIKEATKDSLFNKIDEAVAKGCTRLLFYKNWGHGSEWTEAYEQEYYISAIYHKLHELRDLEQVIWFSTGCYSHLRVPKMVKQMGPPRFEQVTNLFLTGAWEISEGNKTTSSWVKALKANDNDMVAAAKWINKNYPGPGEENPYLGWANLTGKSVVSIKPNGAPPPTPPPTPKKSYLDCSSVPHGASIWLR